ncbi:hypothetical protein [Enterovirga rhinocerotis]|uniref:DUF4149 domain-containing protein n=1 Tax=Enterovirga rhinocerotis TaxID=1339210 RepID=A0A4R7C6P5_9HYPH|nr:hypothetical protein [Enterovirga rhinocerotis]TDR94068.1 hypothetical protein EV668_1340 [Enterovirga rhinocerotis]
MTASRFLFAAVCLLWAGMVLGVSFLATPAKFLAPSLSLPVALDVGRHTFATFAKVEWVVVALLAASALATDIRRMAAATALAMAVLVAIQVFALIPDLDRRVSIYQAGQVPPPSHLHMVYIAIELLKVVVLATGAIAAWQIAAPRPGRDSAGR